LDLKQKRILVTGADGFIGSHLTEELVRRGCEVRAFVFYNSMNSWGLLDDLPPEMKDRIDIFWGDVRDPESVRGAMNGCDVIFHLAALVSIPYSYRSPDSFVETNVKGTLHILQSARELGVAKVIITSTSEVYGTAQFVPITEDHPFHAQSPYAATKIASDELSLSFFRSFAVPVTVVRPFNAYGPRQSARAVIPAIITQVVSGQGRVKLGSLHPVRDFTYVSDTVNGMILAAQTDQALGEVIQIGSNFGISIQETAELIAELMEVEIHIDSEEERVRPRSSEVDRLWADCAKAKRLLGWEPEFSGRDGFSRGLRRTIQWFGRAENLVRYKTGAHLI
jgi:dTDP-glucose 4,6-dehydratase